MSEATNWSGREEGEGRRGCLEIAARVARCAEKVGREGRVKLVAVSKHQDLSRILRARSQGCRDFGENYVQELLRKADVVEDANWHFIGTLQTNKVRRLLPKVSLIHTMDRVNLAREIDKRAAVSGRRIPCLIQVNIGKEKQKGGVVPEEAISLALAVERFEWIDLRGLMTVPPLGPDAESSRPWFRRLRGLRDAMADALGRPLPELSMGMSADFEVAIEEGATLVRVGTALFGPRARGVSGREAGGRGRVGGGHAG